MRCGQSEADAAAPILARPLATRIDNVSYHAEECVRRAQEARLPSLAMQLAESDCTLRVTNTHLCSADSARAKEK